MTEGSSGRRKVEDEEMPNIFEETRIELAGGATRIMLAIRELAARLGEQGLSEEQIEAEMVRHICDRPLETSLDVDWPALVKKAVKTRHMGLRTGAQGEMQMRAIIRELARRHEAKGESEEEIETDILKDLDFFDDERKERLKDFLRRRHTEGNREYRRSSGSRK